MYSKKEKKCGYASELGCVAHIISHNLKRKYTASSYGYNTRHARRMGEILGGKKEKLQNNLGIFNLMVHLRQSFLQDLRLPSRCRQDEQKLI